MHRGRKEPVTPTGSGRSRRSPGGRAFQSLQKRYRGLGQRLGIPPMTATVREPSSSGRSAPAWRNLVDLQTESSDATRYDCCRRKADMTSARATGSVPPRANWATSPTVVFGVPEFGWATDGPDVGHRWATKQNAHCEAGVAFEVFTSVMRWLRGLDLNQRPGL